MPGRRAHICLTLTLCVCVLVAICDGKRHKSHKAKAKAKARQPMNNILEEMDNIRTVKPIQAKHNHHNHAKKSKKVYSTKSMKLLEEDDDVNAAKAVVNEVVTMVSACKHPSTWCTTSLSGEEQTQLNDASVAAEKDLREITGASSTSEQVKLAKSGFNKQLTKIEALLPSSHKLSHHFRWT